MSGSFVMGIIVGASSLFVLDCLVSCIRRGHQGFFMTRSRFGSSLIVSGNIDGSIVQSNGRLFINGTEVGTGQDVQTSCTRSLRITADGKVLDSQLQPGTPIYLKAEPGLAIKDLTIGNELVMTGNIESCETLDIGTSCTITGTVSSNKIDTGTNLKINGNMTCSKADAGTSIHVTGDAYCDKFDAGTGVHVSGQRKRRNSLY